MAPSPYLVYIQAQLNMPGKPHRSFRFWQELKRRKVIKTVAMYAGAAYIVIELVNNVTQPLNLPQWTPRLLILILIIGFPLTAILSWIFDLTPEGFKKTESYEDLYSEEDPGRSRRKLKISDIVIALLMVAVGVLLYPRIFNKDKFESIRDEDGRISIAVLPFENQTGNSDLDYLGQGISSLIINGLGSSKELSVRDDHTMHEVLSSLERMESAGLSPTLARKAARLAQAETYISGSFQGAGNNYVILANLVNTENSEIFWSKRVEGNLVSGEYLDIGYGLCQEIKDYLEIEVMKEDVDFDFREAYTTSAEAYKYYLEGMNLILEQEFDLAMEPLTRAWEIDTTFALAAFYMSWAYCYRNTAEAYKGPAISNWMNKAMVSIHKLPVQYQYLLELWYACFLTEDFDEILRYCDLLSSTETKSRFVWTDLGITYYSMLEIYDKAVTAFAKVEAINTERGEDWTYVPFYRWYGQALHKAGDHEKENEILHKGLQISPEDTYIIFYQLICALSRSDTIAAALLSEELKRTLSEEQYSEAFQEMALGDAYEDADLIDQAMIQYRKALEMEPENLLILSCLADMLIEHDQGMEEGMEIVSRALQMETSSYYLPEYFQYLRGLGLYKRGKYEEAYETLKAVDKEVLGYNHKYGNALNAVEQAISDMQASNLHSP